MRTRTLKSSWVPVGPGKPLPLAVLALAFVSLVGCSRNDTEEASVVVTPPTPAATVPANALVSARAYTEFTASLGLTDTGAALLLPADPAPTSETAAPLPVG